MLDARVQPVKVLKSFHLVLTLKKIAWLFSSHKKPIVAWKQNFLYTAPTYKHLKYHCLQ